MLCNGIAAIDNSAGRKLTDNLKAPSFISPVNLLFEFNKNQENQLFTEKIKNLENYLKK